MLARHNSIALSLCRVIFEGSLLHYDTIAYIVPSNFSVQEYCVRNLSYCIEIFYQKINIFIYIDNIKQRIATEILVLRPQQFQTNNKAKVSNLPAGSTLQLIMKNSFFHR
jgi:hypothetical protein